MADTSNELIALMREFNLEVKMLGPSDDPDPSSPDIAAMLTEIHRLRQIERRMADTSPCRCERQDTQQETRSCSNCKGTGKAERWMPDEPKALMAPCLWCNGTGKWYA